MPALSSVYRDTIGQYPYRSRHRKPKMPAKRLSTMAAKRKPVEPPRDAALRILKIRREMTLIEMQRALGITETAVRRHLQRLQRDGLVSCTPRSLARGRPVNIYQLTQKAVTDYFPTGYEELAARMLDTVFDTEGHRGVFDALVEANRTKIKQLAAQFVLLPLRDRVEGIAAYFREQGYMTDYRALPGGRFFLYHQNCAIYNLAAKYRQLCFVELKLIEALAGTRAARQQYIFKNQPICGYIIDPSQPKLGI